MRLHLGSPRKPAELRFLTSSYGRNTDPHWTDCFTVHPVARMWGVSGGDGWFLGVVTFDERKEARSQGQRREASAKGGEHGE